MSLNKLVIGLIFSFIAVVITGTLSHELGHFTVAKYLGYNARMNYGATFWDSSVPGILPPSHIIAVTLGGPVQTMLTGTLGVMLLFIFRRSFFRSDNLSSGQWIIIFISLFWLRQTVNFCIWIGGYIINGSFYSDSDEVNIARYFKVPDWTIITVTAAIGVIILAVVTFRFVPNGQRLIFLLSGLIGGILGYLFWLVYFGRYIMP